MTHRTGRHWRHAALVAAALLTSVMLAGCGEDNDDPATGPSSDEVAEILGSPAAAKGDALTVGFVYDGTTDAIDSADQLEAAQAAVEYVNEYLGGIAGRPVKLDVCSTDQNPAEAANCVTQFVRDEVPAVISGTLGQGGSVFPALSKANIPVFTSSTIDQASLASPLVFSMTNGIASALAGPAKLAQDSGFETAAIIVTDVPAAAGPVKAAAGLFYGNAGVTPDVVPIPADAADMTPQVQAELTKNPGQFNIIGVPQFCARAIQALNSVGFDGDIVVIPQCIDSTTAETVGSLKGVKVISVSSNDRSAEEYKKYAAVMAKYASETELGGEAPDGYQAVVGFARALEGMSGEPDAKGIVAGLEAMKPTPMPLGDGITFQCDRKQVPDIAPAICSTEALVGSLTDDGQVDDDGYSVIDVSDLMTLG